MRCSLWSRGGLAARTTIQLCLTSARKGRISRYASGSATNAPLMHGISRLYFNENIYYN